MMRNPTSPAVRLATAAFAAAAATACATAVRPSPVVPDTRNAGGARSDVARFVRSPHVAGNRLTFIYADEVWVASIDGSQPRRLTADGARVFNPRLSPDGNSVAFTSDRDGNPDVYVVPADSGAIRRLTWHPADDLVQYWTPDGSGILIASRREPSPWSSATLSTRFYTVPLDGTIPLPLPPAQGAAAMLSPDGTMLAFSNRHFRSTGLFSAIIQRQYRGSDHGNLFVLDLARRSTRQLTDSDLRPGAAGVHDDLPMWGGDGSIYYVSERGDRPQLWRVSARGGRARQVTAHGGTGVLSASISPDGRTIAYEVDYQLHLLDVRTAASSRPALALQRMDLPLHVQESDGLVQSFRVEPDGRRIAVEFRGDIFIVEADSAAREAQRVTATSAREVNPHFSPGGALLAWVSDEGLSEDIWVRDLASGTTRRLTHGETHVAAYAWSPDAQRIAVASARGIAEVDIATGVARTLVQPPLRITERPTLNYSPDGSWLVYTRGIAPAGVRLNLLELASGREHLVAECECQQPFFTADGQHIIALRDEGEQFHLVSLPAPDHAQLGPHGAPTRAIPAEPLRLTAGLRSIGFPWNSADRIYFVARDSIGPAVFSTRHDGTDRMRHASGAFLGVQPFGTDEFAHARIRGRSMEVHVQKLDGSERQRVGFRLIHSSAPRDEWRQLLHESWRILAHNFYDPAMHGADWGAVLRRLEQFVPELNTARDAFVLAGDMIAELRASHLGLAPAGDPPVRARLLPFALESDGSRYRIRHMLLPAAPGVTPSDGGILLSINGHNVRAGDNYWRIIAEAPGDTLRIGVASTSPDGDVVIRAVATTASLQSAAYDEWVASRRDMADAASAGRVGYIHLAAMNEQIAAQLRGELMRSSSMRQAVVLDIRNNQGGHPHEVIAALTRATVLASNPRAGAVLTPGAVTVVPIVLIINERTVSGGEQFAHSFRVLGVGPMVGVTTMGGVIGTDPALLSGGAVVRVPRIGWTAFDRGDHARIGTRLEGSGVAPDIFVINSPDDLMKGRDPQLEAAVREALRLAELRQTNRLGG
jgi:tricorn protease